MTVAQARTDPVALGLRAAAGWEVVGAIGPGRGGGAQPRCGLRDGAGERLASSAALFLAADRPGLRVGALLSATLSHLAHAARLAGQRQACRLTAELTTSAVLVGLLHEALRARQWET
jgi:hypothetical protein